MSTVLIPQEVLKTKKPKSRSKASDPIFRRRNYPYSCAETAYIRKLGPLQKLPRSLVPTRQSPCPPTMHFALVITDAAKELLLKKAEENGETYYDYKLVFPPDFDPDEPLLHPPTREKDCINETFTMDFAASYILKELGIRLAVEQYIDRIAAPTGHLTFGFTLCTNYEMDQLPTLDEIEKVRSYLGIEFPARWYPNGSRFEWVN
ncbi:hypothetical protein NM688_g827 [Phlebia brevispora]|uniref:Uncharacterized protein n=1 Tax=Phlebia brevispora TaxID=194682 RepID=A0ACC1TCX6_9APHY|nr:hypothetical protein NM688_g827 [Phlebia brevispora]